MARASIPVDLFNPGQVFACLGFLEAAETFLGDAEGWFEWRRRAEVIFVLQASGQPNPFEAALGFLASATVTAVAPIGFDDEEDLEPEYSEVFPGATGDHMRLPVRLQAGGRLDVVLGHWADGSGRDDFKLYSGNRSACAIAVAMLQGSKRGEGLASLWKERRPELVARPFDLLVPMGGSFNLDPRGAWVAIDAGYSPNDCGHDTQSSPVVEILAAWGLEHARPNCLDGRRRYAYAVWREPLPPPLARAVLGGAEVVYGQRHFRFDLVLSGKNKVVTFAQEEERHGRDR